MKKNFFNSIWVMGVLTLAVFCLSACDRELDVQQSYPFTVETMPVQKDIVKGQMTEIRCTLKREGDFADTRYTIRYFQLDGKGTLRMDNGTAFKPNDRYPLTKEVSDSTTPPLRQTDKPLMCMWRTTSGKSPNCRSTSITKKRRKRESPSQ